MCHKSVYMLLVPQGNERACCSSELLGIIPSEQHTDWPLLTVLLCDSQLLLALQFMT
jgi:hypothetical protein